MMMDIATGKIVNLYKKLMRELIKEMNQKKNEIEKGNEEEAKYFSEENIPIEKCLFKLFNSFIKNAFIVLGLLPLYILLTALNSFIFGLEPIEALFMIFPESIIFLLISTLALKYLKHQEEKKMRRESNCQI
jgi:uncharacterized membrane protein